MDESLLCGRGTEGVGKGRKAKEIQRVGNGGNKGIKASPMSRVQGWFLGAKVGSAGTEGTTVEESAWGGEA